MKRYRCINPHNQFAGNTALGRRDNTNFEVQLDDWEKWLERMEKGYSPSGWERQDQKDWQEIADNE